jgi:hypothetical protein
MKFQLLAAVSLLLIAFAPVSNKNRSGVEASFSTTKTDCREPTQIVPADSLIEQSPTIAYSGYLFQKRRKRPPPVGTRRENVESSYFVVRHKGRIVAKFDAGFDPTIGNSSGTGWFPLLHNGTTQLVVSQDHFRTGVQWVVDFSKGFRVVFDGLKFQVGRESGDMILSDLDGDGIFEITVPITHFYGFENWRMTTGETPLPNIIFKYDRRKGAYVPANPSFRKCLLNGIEDAERYIRAGNERRLGRLLAVVLDYLLIGEKRRAWQLFDDTYTLPDKSQIKADVMKTLNRHPVYRYFRSQQLLTRKKSGKWASKAIGRL